MRTRTDADNRLTVPGEHYFRTTLSFLKFYNTRPTAAMISLLSFTVNVFDAESE